VRQDSRTAIFPPSHAPLSNKRGNKRPSVAVNCQDGLVKQGRE
jgi:hypothetical protein